MTKLCFQSVGFTGTQKGMTPMQKLNVLKALEEFKPSQCHIGDCIGADKDFHYLCESFNKLGKAIHLIGHIPENASKRAFCKYDHENFPAPYLQRNHSIVDSSDVLFVCPSGRQEELRSGTWATFRYARKTGCPIVIFYSDGTILKQGF